MFTISIIGVNFNRYSVRFSTMKQNMESPKPKSLLSLLTNGECILYDSGEKNRESYFFCHF